MYEPGDDIGVHLTLNAEHAHLPLGPDHPRPVAAVRRRRLPAHRSTTCGSTPTPTRCAASAGPRSSGRWRGASTSTHLAPHLTAITLRPEFFDVYLELAVEFRLPIRLPSTITAEQAGFPFRQLAADEGVVFPDHFDHDWRAGSRDRVYAAIRDLQPGVTEIHVQPAIDTPEVRALSPAADGLDRRPRARRRRPDAAGAARRGRRRADRLPRAQGRACEPAELRSPPRPSAAGRTAGRSARSPSACPACTRRSGRSRRPARRRAAR